MQSKRSERVFLILIILSMIVWGVSWSSGKVLSSYGNASSIAYIRFLMVPIVLSVIIFIMKIPFKIKRKGIYFVAGAGLTMALYSLFFFRGLKLGNAGAGGILITTLNPVFTYLIGLAISRALPNKKEIIGLIVGIIGGATLLNVWKDSSGILLPANILFLLASFSWGILSKLSSFAKNYGNPIAFTFWLNITTIIILSFFVDYSDCIRIFQNADTKFTLNILFFSIVNSSLATTCFLYSTSIIGAEKASSFIFVVPFVAGLGSWLILDETLELHTIIGGLIGILAAFIINKKQKKTIS